MQESNLWLGISEKTQGQSSLSLFFFYWLRKSCIFIYLENIFSYKKERNLLQSNGSKEKIIFYLLKVPPDFFSFRVPLFKQEKSQEVQKMGKNESLVKETLF